jgi:hypothetical protein
MNVTSTVSHNDRYDIEVSKGGALTLVVREYGKEIARVEFGEDETLVLWQALARVYGSR